jgi:hypothetical protein
MPANSQVSNPSNVRPMTRRVLIWSIMACAIFWTLVYKRAQPTSNVPEFIYGNF